MNLEHTTIDTDSEKLVCEFSLRSANAIILHGAGQASRQRYYAVAEELLKHDIGVVMFDFSGHGESTGQLRELSLARRKKQAIAVIDKLVPAGSRLYLIGFSMGAQTACDLLPDYGKCTDAILLACPAVYRADVQEMPFGEDAFTIKLRELDSWQKTDAREYLSSFSGRVVIAIGSNDEVIPKGVVTLLRDSAKRLIYREYKGVPHALAAWLAEHPKELSLLIADLVEPV